MSRPARCPALARLGAPAEPMIAQAAPIHVLRPVRACQAASETPEMCPKTAKNGYIRPAAACFRALFGPFGRRIVTVDARRPVPTCTLVQWGYIGSVPAFTRLPCDARVGPSGLPGYRIFQRRRHY